jgi:D-alanyl-D-alanine dipeptidase
VKLLPVAFFSALVLIGCPSTDAAEKTPQKTPQKTITVPLVEIRSIDPTIVIELRYAGSNNIARRPLYPPGMPALIQPEVGQRLAAAQIMLRRVEYGLKIWDAYRPKSAQVELWRVSRNNDFVADPDAGAGSLHAWGIAVDATLVDKMGHPVSMPTDFDDFTPAAMWRYQGRNEIVRHHLQLLQVAMREAGFLGLRSEWWHFTVVDWQKFLPPETAKRAFEVFYGPGQKKS